MVLTQREFGGGEPVTSSSFRLRAIILVLVALATVALFRWVWTSANFENESCVVANNAAWISVDWVSQPIDEATVAELAGDSASRSLRYLFPFTSYVKSDGSFSTSYAHAHEFISVFRKNNASTKLLAWIGVPIINNRRFGIHGWVDLSSEAERQYIAVSVAQLLEETGFDGVHLNVEHVENGDQNYLLLLRAVREAIRPNHILSVAGNDWAPAILDHFPVIGGYKWNDAYIRSVADQVDQMVIMTYDSLMPLPALYRLWMREQVRGISKGLIDSDVQLLFGLSTSRERTDTHFPEAENLRNGLAGICAGMSAAAGAGHRADGIAIYASWEAIQEDWRIWEAWLAGG